MERHSLVSAVRRRLPGAGTDARPAVLFRVPGRIEVVGKHTDYAGGRSLVGAVERGFVVGGVPRSDGTVHVTDARTGERCETMLAPDAPARGPAWATYLQAVVTLAPGVNLVPEVGYFDYMDNADGDDEGYEWYAGAKWQIDF